MKKLLILAAVIATAFSAQAQRLWKVSGHDAKGATYIMGTHHVAPADMLERTPGFDAALSEAEIVYGELLMSEMSDPTIQERIVTMATAPADSSLSRLLTPAQIDSLDAVLARYTGGMVTSAQIDRLKPVMVNTQLAVMQSMLAFPGFDPAQQIDGLIQGRALQAGKPVRGFETALGQMELLLSEPLTVQAADLMNSVANDSRAASDARRMAKAYEEGDLKAMEAIMNDPATGFTTESAERLIHKRNRAWIETLRKEMPRQPMLVAVGMGHLIGETGLIEALRSAGYTVEPVR